MKIKTVILDFDGTLADTRPAILATFRATLAQLGLPPVSDSDVQASIGLPLAESFARTGGIADPQLLMRATETYRRLFGGFAATAVKLFPHVRETLQLLRTHGIATGVASSRGRESLDELIARLGLRELFTTVCGEEDAPCAKPAPDLALKVLELTGTSPREAVVVGDTSYDILMGRNAGCATCGVTYGNHSREELAAAGADYITDDFAQLLRLPGID